MATSARSRAVGGHNRRPLATIEGSSPLTQIRILLADDHDVVRRGLKGLLEEHEGWEVCGEARTGREAVEMAVRLKPDVAVLDLTMPELNGLDATRRIHGSVPQVEILVFTMHETDDLVRDVLNAGARGYVLKSDALKHIVSAVEALAEHRPFFTRTVSERMLDSFMQGQHNSRSISEPMAQLTPREREIVQLLAEGNSNKGVANLLNLSVKTVETHRAAVMRKLALKSLADLVRYAVRNKLVEA